MLLGVIAIVLIVGAFMAIFSGPPPNNDRGGFFDNDFESSEDNYCDSEYHNFYDAYDECPDCSDDEYYDH